MNKQNMRVQTVFTEPFLATASGNRELQAEYIATKIADFRGEKGTPDETAKKMAEEIEAVPVGEQIEKASTVFQRDDNGLHVWDYSWRGYFKECISQFIELGETKKLNPWNYKKVCDGALFVNPRRVYLFGEDGRVLKEPHGTLQRPLRAMTMRGERVALARSEFVNPGSYCEFDIVVLESTAKRDSAAWPEMTMDLVRKCLDVGVYKGTGQWRSGGYGRFSWHEVVTVANKN